MAPGSGDHDGDSGGQTVRGGHEDDVPGQGERGGLGEGAADGAAPPTDPDDGTGRSYRARPRHDSVPRRRPLTEPASRTSNSSIDSGCASESGQTRLPVAAADTARLATPAA